MRSLTDDLGNGNGPCENADGVGDLFPPWLGNFANPEPLHYQRSPHQNKGYSDP